tara:strand:- start:78 stop:263 length:186 start_codon:yes stop_codon:yes gene_type:complete
MQLRSKDKSGRKKLIGVIPTCQIFQQTAAQSQQGRGVFTGGTSLRITQEKVLKAIDRAGSF